MVSVCNVVGWNENAKSMLQEVLSDISISGSPTSDSSK